MSVSDPKPESDWPALKAWLRTGEYLPEELRDFHDQKLFFKWLVWSKMGQTEGSYLEGINFVNLQVATIDYFLWFMAAFGYKLQRCRKTGVPFADLAATMQAYDRELMEQSARELEAALAADRAKESAE